MKKYFILLSFLFLSFGVYDRLFAVMANPNPIHLEQPDGTEVTLRLNGDEFYGWFEDMDGYTVIKDTQTKYWSYAEKDDFGNLKPSKIFVGKMSPLKAGIKKSLQDENKLFKAQQRRKDFDSDIQKTLSLRQRTSSRNVENGSDFDLSSAANKSSSAIGKKNNFVLLVQFADLKFSDNPPFISSSDADIIKGFDELFNKTGYTKDGAVGSVKDYFNEVSYGQLEYNSVISPIVTINESYTYYAYNKGDYTSSTRVREMIKTALTKLHDAGYDFSSIWSGDTPEGFTVIHAGGGAESGNWDFIWSHKWKLSSTVTYDGIKFSDYHISPAGRGYYGSDGLIRIGVICHESLHFFGLPDLYDTSIYKTYGLGDFCIMASGEWNGDDGKRPAHPCVWAKDFLGWIDFQTATEGTNTIGESATQKDAFYKFTSSNFDAREYFLMENRQSVGFDKDLPGPKRGLLIYHIDERMSDNSDYTHYKVDIEEADGTAVWTNDHLATRANTGRQSDYYRNDTVTMFNDNCVSSPNSKSYTYQSSGIKISGISASSSLMTFVYGKDVIEIDGLSKVVCYPNPARNGYVYITNLPTNTQDFSLEIFTMTSKLVKAFSASDTELNSDGIRQLKWDCKNDTGQSVAPGVYFVLIKNNSEKKIFKVAVIR